MVERSTFREPNPTVNDTDIGRLGTETFLKERVTTSALRQHYQRIVNRASETFAPVIEVLPAEATDSNVTPLMFACVGGAGTPGARVLLLVFFLCFFFV